MFASSSMECVSPAPATFSREHVGGDANVGVNLRPRADAAEACSFSVLRALLSIPSMASVARTSSSFDVHLVISEICYLPPVELQLFWVLASDFLQCQTSCDEASKFLLNSAVPSRDLEKMAVTQKSNAVRILSHQFLAIPDSMRVHAVPI
ncbi:hypothetical protein EON66_08460, partial [archaeon]